VDERKAYFMGIILEKARIKPNVFDGKQDLKKAERALLVHWVIS
jgi:hypothetical protein